MRVNWKVGPHYRRRLFVEHTRNDENYSENPRLGFSLVWNVSWLELWIEISLGHQVYCAGVCCVEAVYTGDQEAWAE